MSGSSDLHITTPIVRPLFALIIGINEYESQGVPSLRGAVRDANDVTKYLRNDLRVPPFRIKQLYDREATRAAIINEFYALQDNTRIAYGDPIFIYYAGHGGETDSPDGWEAGDSKIQMLIPHDFGTKIDGREVFGIPDRTINKLLSNLAYKKGDNITVVFDCCHSGSGTRTSETDPTRLVRVAAIPHKVPSDLDRDIWNRGTQIPPGFLQAGLLSHVLLAACSSRELAQEVQGRGVFTKAFLSTISAFGAETLTYTELLKRMYPLPEQNPQCEGIHQTRIFFNSKVQSHGRVLYDVRKDGAEYIMSAGAAHGITNGAEFHVYKNRESSTITSPLGTLVVSRANVSTSIMAPHPDTSEFTLEEPGVALQIRVGAEEDLNLHTVNKEKLIRALEEVAQEMESRDSDRRSILLVDKDKAHFDVEFEDNEIIFNILDPLVTRYGLTRIPARINLNVDDMYRVMCVQAHYSWHLRRTNTKPVSKDSLYDKVRIEFTELDREARFEGDVFVVDVKRVGQNLNVAGVVDIVVNGDAVYGVKIINDSKKDLYAALFYFDNSDLSITSYYQPPTAGKQKVDPPLKRQQSLTIGYGSGGAPPFNYFLRRGQDVDVGFLKLFITTDHVDFSNVPQSSPFVLDDRDDRHGPKLRPKNMSEWDTVLVTVDLRVFGVSDPGAAVDTCMN